MNSVLKMTIRSSRRRTKKKKQTREEAEAATKIQAIQRGTKSRIATTQKATEKAQNMATTNRFLSGTVKPGDVTKKELDARIAAHQARRFAISERLNQLAEPRTRENHGHPSVRLVRVATFILADNCG